MQKITDLQICGCVMLKYALETGQNELFSALFMALRMESGMDFDTILSTTRDIILPPMPAAGVAVGRSKAGLRENKSSFVFTGELGKFTAEKMTISNN